MGDRRGLGWARPFYNLGWSQGALTRSACGLWGGAQVVLPEREGEMAVRAKRRLWCNQPLSWSNPIGWESQVAGMFYEME